VVVVEASSALPHPTTSSASIATRTATGVIDPLAARPPPLAAPLPC
jgi:hypothetical protein